MCDTRPCKNGKHDDKYLISFLVMLYLWCEEIYLTKEHQHIAVVCGINSVAVHVTFSVSRPHDSHPLKNF